MRVAPTGDAVINLFRPRSPVRFKPSVQEAFHETAVHVLGGEWVGRSERDHDGTLVPPHAHDGTSHRLGRVREDGLHARAKRRSFVGPNLANPVQPLRTPLLEISEGLRLFFLACGIEATFLEERQEITPLPAARGQGYGAPRMEPTSAGGMDCVGDLARRKDFLRTS